ncbi:MAG: DUF3078 domain-containing protein [Bacteroidota bacterium]
MKNSIIILTLALLISLSANSQVTDAEETLKEIPAEEPIEGWTTEGMFSVGFSQVSLTNWAAGGQNSLSGNGLISLSVKYGNKLLSWDNSLDIGYGMVKQGKDALIKTDDKIDFASKFGLRASEKWDYAGLLSFKTQMTPGYDYPNDTVKISNLLSPAYLIGALGMDYKTSGSLSVFIAPLTGKITIVNDPVLSEAGAFDVTPGENHKSEFGGYLKTTYKLEITEDMSFKTKLDLFSNYLEKPQNLDVNWETLLIMKVTKYISVSFATHLIYDENIEIGIDTDDDGEPDKYGPRTQFKQLLTVGFTFNF